MKAASDYRPFADRRRKNWLQRWPELPAMTRALRLRDGVRLLEVGCGRGVALAYFDEHLHPERLVGLDIDAALLGEARTAWRRRGAVELVCADVRAIPFPDASFDVVVDFGTLFHIARPERAVAEIARVLVPGGVFVHETWVSQLISHPLHLLDRCIVAPWAGTPVLARRRTAGLWAAHERVA